MPRKKTRKRTKKKKETVKLANIVEVRSEEDLEQQIRLAASDQIKEVTTVLSKSEIAMGLEDYAGTYTLSRSEFLGNLQPQLMLNAQILLKMMHRYMGGLERGYKKIEEFNDAGFITEDTIGDYFDTFY